MENVTWGSVPTKRTKKVEKYSTPVLTLASLELKGAGRKFIFNKAAIEELALDESKGILFGHGKTQTLFKVVGRTDDGAIPLTKTSTLSNKKHYEFIVDSLELNNKVENEFDIISHADHNSITLKHSEVQEVFLTEETKEMVQNIVEVVEEEKVAIEDDSVSATEETIDESQLEKITPESAWSADFDEEDAMEFAIVDESEEDDSVDPFDQD